MNALTRVSTLPDGTDLAPRLAVVAMIRNEADILPAFLSHIGALFDRALVIDHMSTDGSREILETARAAGQAVEIFTYGVQGYFQAALSNAFARKAFDEGADWAFFLDADEFVDVPDRAALLRLLPGDAHACSFAWRNLAPERLGSFERFDLDQEFRAAGAASRYGKVALSRRIRDRAPGFFIELGNHAVREAPGLAPLPAPAVGEFLHLPIRSVERLTMKVEAGAAAYRAKSRGRTIEGFHWFELLARSRAGRLDEPFLLNVALSYGEALDSLGDLAADAAPRRIAPAGGLSCQVSCLARSAQDTAARDRTIEWTRLRAEGDERVLVRIDNTNTVTLQSRVMRPDGTSGPETFERLPPDPAPLADNVSLQRIGVAVDLACRPIETLTPSAWSRLVPVMFGLVGLLRPRRFVELGSHHGLSFFAANQAMQALDLEAEAIAIDTWQGDPQAGLYSEQVFADFTHLLRTRHPDRGYYIRGLFDDAVACFAAGSIDLLHIDGLHTYDAVRNDFETWLPKMSDRGVIMMHDTTVYERDFGVWQFWREVSARYPALNLLHGHGLGIVYVGREENAFSSMLRRLAAEPDFYVLLNNALRGLGDLSLTAAEARLELGIVADQGVGGATPTSLDALPAELAAARAELAAMRASTSWRISAPVRMLGRLLRRR